MENSFLRDAIDRITELARPSVMKVDDITYATARYYKVDGQQETPDPYEVDTLNALVKMIHTEGTKAYKLLYVRVVSPTCVEVSSGYTRTRDCALDRATLYEADGGAWKLEAKRNIAAYLGEKLADLIESGNVVVMI